MTQQSEHLSNAQIEQYGKRASGAEPETEAWVEQHLDDCSLCRGRVLDFQRTRFAWLPDPKVNKVSTSDCPSEDALRDLAAGLYPDPKAAQLKAHAATCGRCGPLLQEYIEDFSDESSPEEQAFLGQLRTASPEFREQKAREMFEREILKKNPVIPEPAPSTDWRKLFSWKWIMVPALSSVALIALGIWYLQRDTPEKAENYLAQAYTQKRPMEMRWPGAQWGPRQMTLGPSESVFSKPGPLIDAEKMIKDHGTASDDSKWLRARAEAEILEGNPQDAIRLLEPAVKANPDSVPLMQDQALAYAQQYERSHDPKDLQPSLDPLNKVLNKEPTNRPALFNLAFVYGKLAMWDLAVPAWDRYLRIETDPHWLKEAKDQHDEAQDALDKALKNPHSTGQYPSYPSGRVTAFLALNDNEIAFRLEQYQEIALQSWLAKAVANPSGDEYQAVKRLALISERNSSDKWWLDFLHAASNRDIAGVEALSAAFENNKKGFYAKAIYQSSLAAKNFKDRNLPGELRAQLETLYAQRRLLKGQTCLDEAQQLLGRLIPTSYTWLQTQLGMEMAVCLNYVDQLKESDLALSQSLSLAQKSKLPIAMLRNIGFTQSLNNQQGNYGDALDEGLKGLHRYWEGPPSTERIYQFYTGFSRTDQALGLWAAAEAFMRHAIDLLQAEEDDIQKGAAWLELSKILAAESEDTAAEAAARKANQLLDSQIAEPSAEIYRLVGKIGLAELQLQHGKTDEALKTLALARDLPETDPYFVSLTFHRLAGNINRQLHNPDQAESEYHEAILRAERALPGLETNRRRLEWIVASEDAYRGLVRILIARNKPEDAWKLWEWYVSRSYPEELVGPAGGNSHPAGWPELWDVIPRIPQQHGAATRLVYAVFDDGIEIWSVGRDKPKGTWVPARREDLQHMAQKFSQACARRDSSLAEIQKLGQDLFALLVQPVSKELSTGPPISVELDRSLSGLPIEALRSPEGWYLGEKYPIVQSPGVIYEGLLRQPVNLSSSAQFLLADAAEKSFLPGHDLERSTIQKLYPKAMILGPEANSAAIMAPLAESAIFAFIGHGEPYGTGTGLRMNPRLLLKAEDFSPHSLHHLQMAVLAACSTGSSGNDGLLDNRNLVHTFLAGGIPSIVASRWNVDAEATAILISNFYVSYASHAAHASAPDALFSARNQLLKTYNHPYYWAGFSVTGKVN